MQINHQKAFTMVELIFVIVIIGILAAVALPKFGESANQAHLSKAKNAVAIIQSAVTTERQKLILSGHPDQNITSLEPSGTTLFNGINGDTNKPVLGNYVTSCSSGQYCWGKSGSTYTYRSGDATVDFTLSGNRFTCSVGTGASASEKLCKYLTK